MTTTPIDQIRAEGDTLERTMFADADFANEFSYYASYWSKLILPIRDPNDPGFVIGSPVKTKLSQHHYSAIICCWHAHRFRHAIKTIGSAQQTDAGLVLLDAHRHWYGFVLSCKSAHDNLYKCISKLASIPAAATRSFNAGQNSQGRSQVEQRFKTIGDNGTSFPGFAWLLGCMRNELAHNRLNPMRIEKQHVEINTAIFGQVGPGGQDADWNSQPQEKFETLASVADQSWIKFTAGMRDSWKCIEMTSHWANLQTTSATTVPNVRSSAYKPSPGTPDSEPGSSGVRTTP